MRLLLVSSLILLPALASADVVGSEPDACPYGGVPNTCHGGPHCRLDTCASDADCSGEQTCQAVDRCIEVVNCAGGIGPGVDPSEFDVDTVAGTCGSCADGECQSVSICVDPMGGGGCSASTGETPRAWILALLGLALFAPRLRRHG